MTLLGRRNDLAISPIEYPLSRRISISRRSALVMRDHFSFFSCAHSNRWRSNFKDNLPLYRLAHNAVFKYNNICRNAIFLNQRVANFNSELIQKPNFFCSHCSNALNVPLRHQKHVSAVGYLPQSRDYPEILGFSAKPLFKLTSIAKNTIHKLILSIINFQFPINFQ